MVEMSLFGRFLSHNFTRIHVVNDEQLVIIRATIPMNISDSVPISETSWSPIASGFGSYTDNLSDRPYS